MCPNRFIFSMKFDLKGRKKKQRKTFDIQIYIEILRDIPVEKLYLRLDQIINHDMQ